MAMRECSDGRGKQQYKPAQRENTIAKLTRQACALDVRLDHIAAAIQLMIQISQTRNTALSGHSPINMLASSSGLYKRKHTLPARKMDDQNVRAVGLLHQRQLPACPPRHVAGTAAIHFDQRDRVGARALRPRAKYAIFTFASPSNVPSLPMKPGLSSLTTYSMCGANSASRLMSLHLDQARPAIGEHRAGDTARRAVAHRASS